MFESEEQPAKTISEVLGLNPLLPGEPEAEYQLGLKDLITELGAKSILQVYVAEKIYECLWWIRRYEEQKRAIVIAKMVQLTEHLSTINQLSSNQVYLRDHLFSNDVNQKVDAIVSAAGYSMDSLRQDGMQKASKELQLLDQQIALQTKILAGLQASYEVAFNRKRYVERLDLQNLQLSRNLEAIEGEVINDKSKAKKRQSS